MISLLTALSMVTAPQVPEAATFVLSPMYETVQDRVYLGQVATCTGALRLCEEAYGVDLGPSPAPGKSIVLQEGRIRSVVEREWPGASLRLLSEKKEASVKITASGVQVTDAQVMVALRDRLSAGLKASDAFQVDVEKVQVPMGLVTRPGDFGIVFPDLNDGTLAIADWVRKHLVGHQRIQAGIHMRDGGDGEDAVLSFPVQASFILREQVPVVTQSMARGQVVRADDVELSWVETTRGAGKVIQTLDAVVGRRLTRSLSAKDPIPANAVVIPEVVKRGQTVRLEMRGNGIAVSGKVEVLESGGYGQAVDAVYPTTKKKLRVRVVDSETVEYLF